MHIAPRSAHWPASLAPLTLERRKGACSLHRATMPAPPCATLRPPGTDTRATRWSSTVSVVQQVELRQRHSCLAAAALELLRPPCCERMPVTQLILTACARAGSQRGGDRGAVCANTAVVDDTRFAQPAPWLKHSPHVAPHRSPFAHHAFSPPVSTHLSAPTSSVVVVSGTAISGCFDT